MEVNDTSHPYPFLSEWNPYFFLIHIFSQEKERPRRKEYFPKSVAVGILDLYCYERKHNFSWNKTPKALSAKTKENHNVCKGIACILAFLSVG